MEDEQITYLLTVRAEPGVDAMRSLRALLKAMLRTYGLRCVKIQESKQQGRMTMDMRKYSAGVIRLEDLYDGPRVEKIIKISEKETERYTCAVLEFESGDQLYLWNNQARILNNAWGYDSGDWLGQELELSLGHYTDKKTETEKENIIVKPISPRKGAAGNSGGAAVVAIKPMEKPSLRDKMLDEIPF